MTLSNVWEKRRQTLEDLFFAGRDQQLLEELKKHYAMVEQVEALAKVAKVSDRHALETLVECGIRPDNFPALAMVPLTAVAWADGQMHDTERRAILEAAAAAGIEPDTPACKLVHHMLEVHPDPALVDAWKHFIRASCHDLPRDVVELERSDTQDMLKLVAEANGGNMGFGNRVTVMKEAMMHDLLRAFDAWPRELAEPATAQ
jgi:hypothetical protein